MAGLRAALLGLLLCLAGCAAATVPATGERATLSARGDRGAHAPAPSWTGDDAIVALRRRLAVRGFGHEVTTGPMVALWVDEAPPSRLRGEPAVPLAARRSGPGTWLVVTEVGSWWVWEADDLGPVPLPGALVD